MNSDTMTQIPDDVRAALDAAGAILTLDQTVPRGKVRLDPAGTEMSFDDWLRALRSAGVAQRRAAHKAERERRRAGRRQGR